MSTPSPATPPPAARTRVADIPSQRFTKVMIICVGILAIGAFLFMQYLTKLKLDRTARPVTNVEQLRVLEPIKATEMSGKEVNLGDLKGKVWVVGYLYTLCPRGCAGLAEEMKRLQDKFGSHPKFQLVSISLNPETDTPERLRNWTQAQGYSGDNWWFLTGDGPKLRAYMTEQMKLPVAQIPVAERQNEFDLWDHKLALVVVDDHMRFRSASDFSNFDAAETYREKMDEELTRLLKEAEVPAGAN